MQINLSEEQSRELLRALDVHLHRLEMELVKTDDRAYREDLKRTMGTLEGIQRSIQTPAQVRPEIYVSG